MTLSYSHTIVLKRSIGVRKDALVGKCLLHIHGDLSLDLKLSHTKASMVVLVARQQS